LSSSREKDGEWYNPDLHSPISPLTCKKKKRKKGAKKKNNRERRKNGARRKELTKLAEAFLGSWTKEEKKKGHYAHIHAQIHKPWEERWRKGKRTKLMLLLTNV
jgi:hypothetical protein